MLLSEEPHAMDVLPPIPHVLCVHGQGLPLNTQGCHPLKPQSTQAVGPDLTTGTVNRPCHPQIGVCCYTKNKGP